MLELDKSSSKPTEHRFSTVSRSSTLDEHRVTPSPIRPSRTSMSQITSPSDSGYSRNMSSRTGSLVSTAPSSQIDLSPSLALLEPTFSTVDQLCSQGKVKKATSIALSFVFGYVPVHLLRYFAKLISYNASEGSNTPYIPLTQSSAYSTIHQAKSFAHQHLSM